MYAVDNLRAHSELGSLVSNEQLTSISADNPVSADVARKTKPAVYSDYADKHESLSFSCIETMQRWDEEELEEMRAGSTSCVGLRRRVVAFDIDREDETVAPFSLRDLGKRSNVKADDGYVLRRLQLRKRMSLRQLVREQSNGKAKGRRFRAFQPFETGLDTQVDSSGPISWGRPIPRLLPKMRRR
jgi:hypothetical protein